MPTLCQTSEGVFYTFNMDAYPDLIGRHAEDLMFA